MSSKSESVVTITELDNDTVLVGLLESKESVSRKKRRQSKTKPVNKVNKLADGGTYVELLEDRIDLAHHLINDLRANLEQEKFKNAILRMEAVADDSNDSNSQEDRST